MHNDNTMTVQIRHVVVVSMPQAHWFSEQLLAYTPDDLDLLNVLTSLYHSRHSRGSDKAWACLDGGLEATDFCRSSRNHFCLVCF